MAKEKAKPKAKPKAKVHGFPDSPLHEKAQEVSRILGPETNYLLFTFDEATGFQVHRRNIAISQASGAMMWLFTFVTRYFSQEQLVEAQRQQIANEAMTRMGQGQGPGPAVG